MLLIELEQQIKPLSRPEKIHLIHFLAEELDQADDQAELASMFTPGETYAVFTPVIDEETAQRVQTFIQEHQRA
jgi:hypothetical protein